MYKIFPLQHHIIVTKGSLASTENLTNQSQNLPAFGCCPASFFSAFLGSSQPAGRCQPHRVLGKVYFHGPSALLNGLCEAQGAERHANTARVMGAVCTWVIPAKNICIEGAMKHLEWKHPPNGTLLGLQKNSSAPDNLVGFSSTSCLHWDFLGCFFFFFLIEFHDPQAFETCLKSYCIFLKKWMGIKRRQSCFLLSWKA